MAVVPVSERDIVFRTPIDRARANRRGRPPLLAVPGDLADIADPRLGIDDRELAQLCLTATSRFVGNQSGQRGAVPRLGKLLACLAHVAAEGEPAPHPSIPLKGWPAMDGVHRRAIKNGRPWRNTFTVDEMWSLELGLNEVHAALSVQLMVEIYPPPLWPMVATVIEWGPREFARRCNRFFHLGARGQAPGYERMTRETIRHCQGAAWQFMEALAQLEEQGYPHALLRRGATSCDLHLGQMIDSTECEECVPALSWNRQFIPRRERVRVFKARSMRGHRTAPDHETVLQILERLERELAALRRTNPGYMRLHRFLRDRSLIELFCVLGGRVEAMSEMRKGPWERREGELVVSVDWEHTFLDGSVGVGVGLFPGKSEENLEDDVQRWKKVPPIAAAHLREYWDYAGFDECPDGQPVWFGDWEYVLDATGELVPRPDHHSALPAGISRRPSRSGMSPASISTRIGNLLGAGPEGRRYSAHTLRHYAHQMGHDAAEEFLRAHPETRAKINAKVIVKCLLDHSFGQIAELYDGLRAEETREKWAAVCSAGIEDHVLGAKGKKKDIDRQAIISARQALQEAHADFAASKRELELLDLELRQLEEGKSRLQRELKAYLSEAESALADFRERQRTLRADAGRRVGDEQGWRHLEAELGVLGDEIDARRDAAAAEERRLRTAIELERNGLARRQREAGELLLELQARVSEHERALEDACSVRLPVSAYAPTRTKEEMETEIRQLAHGLIPEQARVTVTERPPARDWLTPNEMARALGIKESTLRAQLLRALASPTGLAFGSGDRRNPWHQPISEILEVNGPRTRRFIFSRLDLSKYHPSQIAQMREMLTEASPTA